MDQAAAKQQIVERIKQANNILVTVSTNPSVDQLAACIGATLMLNKLQKHATAVFSGAIPSTIEFLQPEKTLETNTDSLRDFIISLDKAKADKLRYKVEDQVVRIFITPYKTSLSEKDLVFSQGDFNVEVVLALGVKDRSHVDAAIAAQGRILHDATVVSLNAGPEKVPEVGQLNWQDPAASSLSEMLVSISEAFGTGLIDNQMATAFLTGIVAETDRFSNPRTTPKVMTMSAQLMAAGANQQLIVSNIETAAPVEVAVQQKAKMPATPKQPEKTNVLIVPHDEAKPAETADTRVVKEDEIHIDERGNIIGPQGNGNGNGSATQTSVGPPRLDVAKTVAPPSSAQSALVTPSSASVAEPIREEKVVKPDSLLSPPSAASTQSASQVTVAGGHTLLDPAQRQPSGTPAFSADTSAGSDSLPSTDPLSEQAKTPELSGQASGLGGAAQTKPSVDNARNAVQSAITAPPPGTTYPAPIQSLNAQPMVEVQSQLLHQSEPQQTKPPNTPPPPPVPPPINFGQGVVIPSVNPPVNPQNNRQPPVQPSK